jgi:hypothetical protein
MFALTHNPPPEGVLPVLLGDGIPLFATRRQQRLELEPISVRQSGQATLLHYRVKR